MLIPQIGSRHVLVRALLDTLVWVCKAIIISVLSLFVLMVVTRSVRLPTRRRLSTTDEGYRSVRIPSDVPTQPLMPSFHGFRERRWHIVH